MSLISVLSSLNEADKRVINCALGFQFTPWSDNTLAVLRTVDEYLGKYHPLALLMTNKYMLLYGEATVDIS